MLFLLLNHRKYGRSAQEVPGFHRGDTRVPEDRAESSVAHARFSLFSALHLGQRELERNEWVCNHFSLIFLPRMYSICIKCESILNY